MKKVSQKNCIYCEPDFTCVLHLGPPPRRTGKRCLHRHWVVLDRFKAECACGITREQSRLPTNATKYKSYKDAFRKLLDK